MCHGCEGLVRVFQELQIYWDSLAQPSLGFTEDSLKKKTYPVISSCVGRKYLVDVRGQRSISRLVSDYRKVTVAQITT